MAPRIVVTGASLSGITAVRCRSGHAFSAESLASGQSEARYDLLSSMFGTLAEEGTLLKRLAGLEAGAQAGRHQAQALRLQPQTAQVCEWLRSTAGLAEPETPTLSSDAKR